VGTLVENKSFRTTAGYPKFWEETCSNSNVFMLTVFFNLVTGLMFKPAENERKRFQELNYERSPIYT